MKPRYAIFATAIALGSLMTFLAAPPRPEDAPLMATGAGKFGDWTGMVMFCWVAVGLVYLLYRGIRRLFRR